MFCTNCGRQIEDDAVYCNYCGYKVLEDRVEKKEEKPDVKEEYKVEKKEDRVEEKEEKIEEKEEKLEVKEEYKIEEKEEKIEEKEDKVDIFKYISKSSKRLCIMLLLIGTVTSMATIVKFYIAEKDINYIFGQAIFILAFIISIILLWKLEKIGSAVLISFILFKMAGSIYYYIEASSEYLIKNLIVDEIFYIIIISLVVIGWKKRRIEVKA